MHSHRDRRITICLDLSVPSVKQSENIQKVEFDPFAMLSDMVSQSAISVAGACLLNSFSTSEAEEDEEGDSLVNIGCQRRESCREAVSNIIAACDDNSWRLQHNDIVYVGSEPFPCVVYRIGFGDYEREVRVARMGEDVSLRCSGRWVFTTQCYKLEAGDRLVTTQDCVDASHDMNVLKKGNEYTYRGRDDEGDFILASPSKTYMIFREDLDKFSLQ